MLVKMKTLDASPEGTFHPGSVRNVSEKEGADLISGGYAVEYKRAPVAANKSAPQGENKAALQAGLEQAAAQLDKAAQEAEGAAKGAKKQDRAEAFKAAKEARKAAEDAVEKLNAFKKAN